MTAGDEVLRWMMMTDFDTSSIQHKRVIFRAWALRKKDCCVDCAIKYLKQNLQGDNIEYCHVGLIT